MRNVKLFLFLCLMLAFSVPASARTQQQNDTLEQDGLYAADAGGIAAAVAGGAAAVGVMTIGAPLALVALEANNVDPWHPLACALFGGDARVGNETSAHCN